jgi:hypothetical protein
MDPLLFRKQLEPIQEKFPLLDILTLCYPLKGMWTWEKISNTGDKDILSLFRQVHMSSSPVKIGQGQHHIEEWCVDTDYNHPLYKKLVVFMKGQEDEESEQPEEPPKPVFIPKKIIPPKEPQRDTKWRDLNPLLNPRLEDDIESGFLVQPEGVDILPLINRISELDDNEWLCADCNGDVSTTPEIKIHEFGLYGIPKSVKCVKIVSFLRSIAKNYSLDYNVDQYITMVEQRQNIWKWIQVGDGWYRDFERMLVGSRDMITKLKRSIVIKPLQKRAKKGNFQFDCSNIFTAPNDQCLNITSQQLVSKKGRQVDQYGWCSDKEVNVQEVRAYIFSKFMAGYKFNIIPEMPDKKAKKFIESLDVTEGYIDLSTLKPIKYSAVTNKTHSFSKLGFAINKEISTKCWSVAELDYFINRYLDGL